MEMGYYYVSMTTTTPRPALPASIPLYSNAKAMVSQCFLQATSCELLSTFCMGGSTLFPTEKAGCQGDTLHWKH